jgi:hypothetical protein
MSGQITPAHESEFTKLLQTVDNAGARAVFSHVWDGLKEVVGVAVPVVEATIPGAVPVVAAVATTIEEIDQQIQALLAAKAQKMAAPQSETPPTS